MSFIFSCNIKNCPDLASFQLQRFVRRQERGGKSRDLGSRTPAIPPHPFRWTLPFAGAWAEQNLSGGFVVDEQQGTKCTTCVWEGAETSRSCSASSFAKHIWFCCCCCWCCKVRGRWTVAAPISVSCSLCQGREGLGVWQAEIQGWGGSAGSRGRAGQVAVGWQSCAQG